MSKQTLHDIVKNISRTGQASFNEDNISLPNTLVSLGLCYVSYTRFSSSTFYPKGRMIYKLTPTDKWSDLMTNWLKANYKELRSDGK